VIVALLAVSMLIYVGVAFLAVRGKQTSANLDYPVAAYATGGLLLVGAAATITRIGAAPANSLERFRSLSLLATVILEWGVIMGLIFTMFTRSMKPVLVLGAAGLLGIGAFVVPAGNAYFRELKGRRQEAPSLDPS
jgi:ABC-type uncharacterized transport system permease subunit